MTRHLCMDCGAALSGDEIALHKKIICRVAEQYYWMDCLAAFCSTSRERLEQLVSYYHRTGECILFAKQENTHAGQME